MDSLVAWLILTLDLPDLLTYLLTGFYLIRSKTYIQDKETYF